MNRILLLCSMTLLVFAANSPEASARACNGNDRHVSTTTRVNRMSCRASGYCYAYGRNPANGRYENYYGYHSNCPGQQEQRVTVYKCLNSLGIGYTRESYGPWGMCRVR